MAIGQYGRLVWALMAAFVVRMGAYTVEQRMGLL
jgi:hypothetical protein